MFGPILSISLVAAILFGSAFAIAWRLSKLKPYGVRGGFFAYLILAIMVGSVFAYLPTMVLNRGMAFWLDDAQPFTFYGLMIWFVLSVASMFLVSNRHLVVPVFSIFAVFVDFILFLFMAEASDLETLGLTFTLMRSSGIALIVLAAISLWIADQDRKRQLRT